ncbi:MAG: Hint domain-containing protein [Pseudomonadota bacterium]
MPTTFTVFFLGNEPDLDTNEGNFTAENAGAIVGNTYGGPGNALVNHAQTFSPGSTGYQGGSYSTAYDQNTTGDTFRIDGGGDQTFDSVAVYNATVTYIDGDTAMISAVIFQDDAGNTYLAPEFSRNSDQLVLEAKPLQAITLDSLLVDRAAGLNFSREDINYVTCFTPGTRIAVPDGERRVESLRPGDLVSTRDHGAQRLRWVGRNRVALGKARKGEDRARLCPVVIRAGALGCGLPRRDLRVSPQHRILVRSRHAREVLGVDEALVPAKKLLPLPGVRLARGQRQATYLHLMLDRHEVIFAEGAPTESLFAGKMALRELGRAQVAELQEALPGALAAAAIPARHLADGRGGRDLVDAIKEQGTSLLAA